MKFVAWTPLSKFSYPHTKRYHEQRQLQEKIVDTELQPTKIRPRAGCPWYSLSDYPKLPVVFRFPNCYKVILVEMDRPGYGLHQRYAREDPHGR